MRSLTSAIIATAVVLASGCASVDVQRGKDVSAAGIAYTKATTALLDAALDAAIDADNQNRQLTATVAKTAEERETQSKLLAGFDDGLVTRAQLLMRLKRSSSALEAYFLGLQSLAGATPGDAAETAVKGLADRLNGLSTATGGATLATAEQKTATAGFAKALVRQAHGAAVGRALERDADSVGRVLILQQLALATVADQLRNDLAVININFHRQRVLDPFLSGTPPARWAEDRKTYLKARAAGATIQAVAAVEQASVAMQEAWKRVLSGESSPQDFNRVLQEVGELVDALTAVKKAY